MNKIFKKILIEIDKLPSVDKKSLLELNTYQLEIMSKILKKKKNNILRNTKFSN